MNKFIILDEYRKKLVFLTLIIICACSNGIPVLEEIDESKGPAQVYMDFKEACDIGDLATAESLVTTDLKDRALSDPYGIGVCGFTHDMGNRFVKEYGSDEIFQEFVSSVPVTTLKGNTAELVWLDTSGNLVTVTMYNIEGEWKVNNWVLSIKK